MLLISIFCICCFSCNQSREIDEVDQYDMLYMCKENYITIYTYVVLKGKCIVRFVTFLFSIYEAIFKYILCILYLVMCRTMFMNSKICVFPMLMQLHTSEKRGLRSTF